MKRFRNKSLRMVAGGLALVAALTAAALPSGFLPKIAGRCGRELCNCEPEIDSSHCKWCVGTPTQRGPSKRMMTFAATSVNNADAPGNALQFVFSGLLTPQAVQHTFSSELGESRLPSESGFALSRPDLDVPLQPPRA